MIKKLLMVDDDHDFLLFGKLLALRSNMVKEVITCSATEALLYLHTCANNRGEIPDVIFLDLNMPDLDGLGFLNEFDGLPESVKKETKIFIVSSSIEENEYQKAVEFPRVFGSFQKPLTLDDLNSVALLLS